MDEPLPDPDLDAEERTAFRLLVDGDETGTGTLRLGPEDDRTFICAAEGEGFGRLTGTGAVRFRRRGGQLLADEQTFEIRDRDREVLSEQARFRDIKVPVPGGELAAYPRTTVPAVGVAAALRLLPWSKGTRVRVPVWLAAVVVWPLDMRVEGTSKVEVPAGRFEAHRIRIRPSLANVAQALDELSATVVPPVSAYVDTKTQRLLALDFPTGLGKGDPAGRIEATALD